MLSRKGKKSGQDTLWLLVAIISVFYFSANYEIFRNDRDVSVLINVSARFNASLCLLISLMPEFNLILVVTSITID